MVDALAKKPTTKNIKQRSVKKVFQTNYKKGTPIIFCDKSLALLQRKK